MRLTIKESTRQQSTTKRQPASPLGLVFPLAPRAYALFVSLVFQHLLRQFHISVPRRDTIEIDGVVDITNHQVNRINHVVEFHVVPIAKNIAPDFNDCRSSWWNRTVVDDRRRKISVGIRVATVGRRLVKKGVKIQLIGLNVGLSWRSDNFTEERERANG